MSLQKVVSLGGRTSETIRSRKVRETQLNFSVACRAIKKYGRTCSASLRFTLQVLGLSNIETWRNTLGKHQSIIARGMIDRFPGRPFEVYIDSLSASPILFTKNMGMMYASKAPDYIGHPRRRKTNFGQPKKFWQKWSETYDKTRSPKCVRNGR